MSEAAAVIDETKKPETYLHTCEVDVADEETQARISRLIEVEHKINETEADKASRNSDFNTELKQLRKERNKLLDVIKTKRERKDVEVFDRYEERTNTVYIVRASDSKVLGERAMTLEDRMNLGKSKEEAEKAQKATESPGEQAAANDGAKPPGKANAAGTVTRIKASDAKKKKAEREAKEAADKARAAADAKDAENSDDEEETA